MSDSQIIRPKKVKIYHTVKFIGRSNLPCSTVFSFRQHFFETKTTDIVMLLQVLLQFCNNSGFVVTSGIIMLFCQLLED